MNANERMRVGVSVRTSFWTHSDVFCVECDGDGGFDLLEDGGWLDCKDCCATGYEPIPWTELFMTRRVDAK